MRQELQATHEYEVVLNYGVNAKQYQLPTIKKAAGNRPQPITNSCYSIFSGCQRKSGKQLKGRRCLSNEFILGKGL